MRHINVLIGKGMTDLHRNLFRALGPFKLVQAFHKEQENLSNDKVGFYFEMEIIRFSEKSGVFFCRPVVTGENRFWRSLCFRPCFFRVVFSPS